MFSRTCKICAKNFKSRWEDSNECFTCMLKILSGDYPPDMDDVNTARIISGEYTQEEFDKVIRE